MPIQVEELDKAIRDAFPVSHLEIEDKSSGCGESYSIFLVSQAFEGKSTLARHRAINAALKDQIAQMHAFTQKTYTPEQYKAYLEKGQ